MRKRNRVLKANQFTLAEQLRDFSEWFRIHRTLESLLARTTPHTPAQFHGVLGDFLTAQLSDAKSPYHTDHSSFFADLEQFGLVRAVIRHAHADEDDYWSAWPWEGCKVCTPHRAWVWRFIAYALEHENADWQQRAARLVPAFAPDWPTAATVLTPAPMRARLGELLTAPVRDRESPEHAWHAAFWDDIGSLRLVRGVLVHLDRDREGDGYSQDPRPSCLPDRVLAWECIVFAIAHEEHYWRQRAVSWVAAYAPSWESAVAALTPAMREGSPLAALRLSELAPETPGIVAALGEALLPDWDDPDYAHRGDSPWGFRHWTYSATGPALAADALARLGAGADHLRAAIFSERSVYDALADREKAFEAFVAVTRDEREIRSLLADAAHRPDVAGDLLGATATLGQSQPRYLSCLAELVRSRFWRTHRQDYPASEWHVAIRLLGSCGRDAGVILPALAASLEGTSSEWRDVAIEAVTQFLKGLATADEPTPEDGLLLALRGVPASDVGWLVYADWLADRDDIRAEFIRVWHALAVTNGEDMALREQRDCWLIAHGGGWVDLYDRVSWYAEEAVEVEE